MLQWKWVSDSKPCTIWRLRYWLAEKMQQKYGFVFCLYIEKYVSAFGENVFPLFHFGFGYIA